MFSTAALTIIGGVVVYVIGQLINEFLIKQYLDYRRIIGEIREELMFYSNIYTNAGIWLTFKPISEDASTGLRRLASQLSSNYKMLTAKSYFLTNGWIMTQEKTDEVISNLIFLSNSLWNSSYIIKNLEKSSETLKLLDSER